LGFAIEFNHASLNQIKALGKVSASGELIARYLISGKELTKSLLINKE
jgi:hypothetical protein